MKLQGRNLEPNLRGGDVKLLQSELRQLKLTTQIVDPEGFFGSTTFLAVQEFQRQHGLPVTGVVDARTASYINRAIDGQPREFYLVKGRVHRPDGEPVPRAQVRAFEKHIRREIPLGEDAVDPLGSFEISYPVPEQGRLSLVIRAFDLRDAELASSPVICDAKPVEIVDLVLGNESFRGSSEFRRLQDVLMPVLNQEHVAPGDLTENDVSLLACQQDLDAEHLAYFVVSARLANETDLPAEWFYALVRQGLPTALTALVAQAPEILRRALESSVQENVVSAAIAKATPEILRRLQEQIVRLALRPSEPDRPTMGALLDIAEIQAPLKERILSDYLNRKGTVEEYWITLRQQPELGDAAVDAIQHVLRVATITINHEPLIRELVGMRTRGEIGADVRDLARFSRKDWQSLIERKVDGRTIGAPAVLGGDEKDRTARYAVFLARMVEAVFPTAVLRHRLAEANSRTFEPTIAFLARNPDFDFTAMRLHEYLKEHPGAIEGDVEAATKQLKAVQRLMNIAPPFNKAAAVLHIADGIESATTIRRIGAPQYLRAHADKFDSVSEAQQFYSNAARHADTALLLLSQSAVFNPTQITITAPHLFGEGVPDLEDLFGSLDLCQCEWCESVYSPAAYLVDILHFLMNRPAVTPGRTALDVLFGDPADPSQRRRGDIGHIELTCQNANTELPYVDLVNEILEQTIEPGPELSFQTLGAAELLAANPEHLNVAAYNTLGNAAYPWVLPFDLWAAEARSYLAQLGISRHQLTAAFLPDAITGTAGVYTAEYLGMTPREREIITGDAGEPTRVFWGMEPGEFTQFLSQRRASRMLKQSGLSYEELVAVLAVRFVNAGTSMRVQFAGADCNLDTATVTGLTEAALNRMHRFVRLQRKLGWSTPELGTLLEVLQINQLNGDALLRIAQVKRVREAINPSWETLVTWWSQDMATQGSDNKPSLYERIFSDPTINPPTVSIFELNDAGSELRQSDLSITDHANEVASAIGISVEDVNLLVIGELPGDRLNLANLTRLYSIATLARALKLGISEFVMMRGLTGVDPVGPNRVTQTDQFVRSVNDIRKVGIDPVVLDYLFRHRTGSSSAIWSESQVVDFFTKLRTGLRSIAADHAFAPDPAGERTATTLPLLLPPDVVNRTMAMLAGNTGEDQAALTALINDQLSVFLDPADAIERLINPGTLESAEARFDYLLPPLLDYLARRASEASVIENLATALALPSVLAERLLREWIPAPTDPGTSSLAIFLALAAMEDAEVVETDFPDQSRAFHRLAKNAIVLNALAVPPDHVEFMLTRGPSLGWVDLTTLPLDTQDSAGSLIEQWSAQAALFRFSAGVSGGVTGLFELLRYLNEPGEVEPTHGDLLDRVAAWANWNRADIEFLVGPEGFNFSFPSGFLNGQFLLRLKPCFSLLSVLGVSAEEARRWVDLAAPLTQTAEYARAIKQAVRAKYPDQQQWLTIARPIRDELREQQRAALVAYLLHAIRIQIPRLRTGNPALFFQPLPPWEPIPPLSHMVGPAVEELQLILNLSNVVSRPLVVSGFFDMTTSGALLAFQQVHGLPVNGVTTEATWEALDQVRQRLRGPSDLYAHFLIDVEMDACMLTSRLVQATNSVQLFVQRCLLNLEPEVKLTPEDAKEWGWMKNYRVWEANRKVFLYPENWIEPELRDDKTPFFKQLESGLLQDEVNDATVEREYLKYLQELDRVAQLEISGLYRQWEVDRDILHVFGRTRNTPHLYYYRRWMDQRYWTPWEKVEVDIEGDHLVPVVWNRRLYLFWPMFMEKAVEQLGDSETPQRYYEIRLAWSEFREGKWSPKRVSTNFTKTVSTHELPEKTRFSFWSYFDGNNDLLIACEMLDSEGKEIQFPPPHFQLDASSGSVQLKRRGFVVTDLPLLTRRFFNMLEETGSHALSLNVAATTTAVYSRKLETETTLGFPIMVWVGGFQDQISQSTELVLNLTPGKFYVIPSHAERPLASRNPFFYQDDARTFFVVPSGGYSGGFGVGDLKVNLAPIQDSVPVELPDSVVSRVRTLAGRSADSDMQGPDVSEWSGNDLRLPSPSLTAGSGTRNETNKSISIKAILEASVADHTAAPASWESKFFHFDTFYHPYVSLLIEQLNRHGVVGILRPDPEKESTQERRDQAIALHRQRMSEAFFNAEYAPNPHNVANVYGVSHLHPLSQSEKNAAGPFDEFDFTFSGAYSLYNWELFFHGPFMIAKGLSANRRFTEAQRWFHYIFDPTYNPATPQNERWPERVWQIKPFFEHGVGKSIQKTMLLLKSPGLSKKELAERAELRNQIEAWRKTPFNPHLIARMRNEAYMKSVVMAYLDNLIAWGDDLFRQDTRESVNEATQLYVLASEILGDRPREIAAHEGTRKTIDGQVVSTFEQLRGHLDAFSNVLVELETIIYPMENPTSGGGGVGHLLGATDFKLNTGSDDNPSADVPLAAPGIEPPDDGTRVIDFPLATPVPAIIGPTLFFCIPKNDKLMGYWDTVADRLFKIRHCMNIEGVERQLALFSPPIDPGLLVKAAAAGLDLGDVLSDLNAPSPIYRFQVLAQKANELISDVKTLGAALLSSLEKRDAEELAVLRSTQEIDLLNAVRETKLKQIDEAKRTKESLEQSKTVIENRKQHYENLTKEFTNAKEKEHQLKLEQAQQLQIGSQAVEILRAVFAIFPELDIGVAGISSSPLVKVSWGGSNIAAAHQAISQGLALGAHISTYEANKALTDAGYVRRAEEWTFQAGQAGLESTQIEKQIAAADLRLGMAEKDLENHDLQIENAKAIDEYMRSKYTNTELYNWMIGQISAAYFQSYQLAYDLAKRAERAFRHELGIPDTNFIKPGYWDSLKKGLLAGERLQNALRQMEAAYLDQNRREYEITQHFSLALLDARALLQLRETGECEFAIPELAFDIGYPGHYMRRIKSASITVPCVTGPYTNVSARLTLLKNRVRINGSSQQNYAYTGIDDPNFRHDLIGIQSIATSTGQNDSGLFQFNFQDERYLPFERAGAISTWRLSLPNGFRSFDYGTISDVILHLSYTAREGGDALRLTAETHVNNEFNRWLDEVAQQEQGLYRLVSFKHEFSSQLHHLLFPAEGTPQSTTLPLSRRHFPHFLRTRSLTATRAMLIIKPREGEAFDSSGLAVTLNGIEGSPFAIIPALNDLPATEFTLNLALEAEGGSPWELVITNGAIAPERVADVYLLITYTVASS